MQIDVAFFTDFLVVLMSNQIEKQLKVTFTERSAKKNMINKYPTINNNPHPNSH